MVLCVFDAQTFIFAVLYKKNKSFQPKVLYCTKKNKKNNASRSLARGPGWLGPASKATGLETLFFLVFLVQYSTFGWNDWFFLYSTAKMKVWASKTNKTIRFYWFSQTADQFYWYSTAKIKLSKTICICVCNSKLHFWCTVPKNLIWSLANDSEWFSTSPLEVLKRLQLLMGPSCIVCSSWWGHPTLSATPGVAILHRLQLLVGLSC